MTLPGLPSRLACALLLAVLTVAGTPRTSAADPREADAVDEHYEEGTRLFKAGRYEDAVVAFEQALALGGEPGTLYDLAQAHQKLGHLDKALVNLRMFLRISPKSPLRFMVRQQIKALARKLAAARVTDDHAVPPASSAAPAPVVQAPAPPAPAPSSPAGASPAPAAAAPAPDPVAEPSPAVAQAAPPPSIAEPAPPTTAPAATIERTAPAPLAPAPAIERTAPAPVAPAPIALASVEQPTAPAAPPAPAPVERPAPPVEAKAPPVEAKARPVEVKVPLAEKPAPPVAPVETRLALPPESPAPPHGHDTAEILAEAVMVAGGAILGAGIGLVIWARQTAGENDYASSPNPDVQSRANHLSAASTGLSVAGAVTMVVGGGMIWQHYRRGETKPRVSIAPIPGGAAAAVGFSF